MSFLMKTIHGYILDKPVCQKLTQGYIYNKNNNYFKIINKSNKSC